LGGNDDTLRFGVGIAPGDIHVGRNEEEFDLVLSIVGTTDSITLEDQLFYTTINYKADLIETVEFADATTWSHTTLRSLYLAQSSTSGNDHIIAFESNDILDGGAGNDTLEGGDGSDNYVFARGYGNDLIIEAVHVVTYDDFDRVGFEGVDLAEVSLARVGTYGVAITIIDTGETLTIQDQLAYTGSGTWHDIEEFAFDDVALGKQQLSNLLIAQSNTSGNDTIDGTDGNDDFQCGLGNDILRGGKGSDRYYYNSGDGADTIYDHSTGPLSEQDRLILGAGIDPDDVTVTRSTDLDDVTLTFAGGGSIFLDEQLGGFYPTELRSSSSLTVLCGPRQISGRGWSWPRMATMLSTEPMRATSSRAALATTPCAVARGLTATTTTWATVRTSSMITVPVRRASRTS
jgi:Ca2+-binding RTX toxin-like protein